MSKKILVPNPDGIGVYERYLLQWFDFAIYANYIDRDTLPPSADGEVIEFGPLSTSSTFSRFRNRTLSRMEYAAFSPPADVDTVVTTALVAKEVSARPSQHLVHLTHGIHRGCLGLPPRTGFSDNSIIALAQKLNRRWLRWRETRRLAAMDTVVANSKFTANDLERFFNISDSVVIPPPVDVGSYSSSTERDDYYLYLGRLDPEKRVREIVRVFNKMKRQLIVAGDGSLADEIEALAGPSVNVVGYVSETKKRDLFSKCAGFIQNTIAEPFGITTVEALASGAPVIAVNDGNNPHLIDDESTGLLFDRQGDAEIYQTGRSDAQLKTAVNRADEINWNHDAIRASAWDYDVSECREKWRSVIC